MTRLAIALLLLAAATGMACPPVDENAPEAVTVTLRPDGARLGPTVMTTFDARSLGLSIYINPEVYEYSNLDDLWAGFPARLTSPGGPRLTPEGVVEMYGKIKQRGGMDMLLVCRRESTTVWHCRPRAES